MIWSLVAVLVVGALAVLAVTGLGLWRRVKALSRTVADAGETVGVATEQLASAQADGPTGQTGPAQHEDVTSRPPGVPPASRPGSARRA